MSAEIGATETEVAEEHTIAVSSEKATFDLNGSVECHEGDNAADFLLTNSKYNDCFLNVGNPETDEVERIGVTSVYLIAISPVFREMFESHKLSDLPDSQICITDVSSATFKLLLRYVYGGKLTKMTATEAARLALCADRYQIPCLVKKTLKQLSPTSAEDLFPALICVTYATFPELEVQVTEIIQRETDEVVQNADFLKLTEECMLFILKQNTLNINEVDLWLNVVRWAKKQVTMNPARTLRDCLAKTLRFVRFLTFTSDDLLEFVLPLKALTPEEYVDLALAVAKKQELQSSILCNIQEKRNLYLEEEEEEEESVIAKLSRENLVIGVKSKPKTISYIQQVLCFYTFRLF